MKSELLLEPTPTALIQSDVIMHGTEQKYLQVVVAPLERQVSSAPNSRSCSFKKTHRRPHDLDLGESRVGGGGGGDGGGGRPRTNSLPSCHGGGRRQRHSSDGSSSTQDPDGREGSSDKLCRVRSFKLTSKGVVNHGDCFKRMSTHSLMSTGSTATDPALPSDQPRTRALSEASEASSSGVISGGTGSCCAPSYFRVVLLGACGVGKSAILRQFMTSEYRGTFDLATPDAEDPETTVSVLLDGEESMIEFIDQPKESELESLRADAFVVMFSLADLDSYTSAVTTLRHLRVDLGVDRSILLVGNKVDLARQRRVEEREARTLAMKYDCQYEETSAALNHHVDELLVAILSQIRQRLAPPADCHSLLSVKTPVMNCCSPSPRRALNFLNKLFRYNQNKTKSCDNLLIH